jgi:hypothetical protein
VRWLLATGKIEEARSIILKAAKRNGVVLSDDTLNKFEMTSVSEGKYVSGLLCDSFCDSLRFARDA